MSDLTPEEQAELDRYESEQADDLTPEERRELASYESEAGGYERFAQRALPMAQRAMQSGLEGVGAVSSAIDRYTGGPVRHAVSKIQEGQNPLEGYDYEKTPQWSDIYGKAGVPTEKSIKSPVIMNPFDPSKNRMSPADIAGAATGAVMDPLNLVPLGTMGRGARMVGEGAEAFSRGMNTPARKLGEFAEERAAKTALGPGIGKFREVAGATMRGEPDMEKAQGKIRNLGRKMLDDGQVGWLSTTEGIGKGASKEFSRLKGEIGEVGSMVDAAIPEGAISGQQIADRLVEYASQIPETEGGKALQNRILAEAANFEKIPSMTFAQAQKFKNQFQYKPQAADAFESSQDAVNGIKRIIGEAMEEGSDAAIARLSQSGDPIDQKTAGRIGLYRDLKKKYGSYKQVAKSATDQMLKDTSNNFFSPMNTVMGSVAGAGSFAGGADPLSSMLLGAATTGGVQFARNRGGAFFAKTADALRKVIQSNPEKFRRWGDTLYRASVAGNSSLVVTHQLLMQSDPEYRQLILSQERAQ